MNNFSLEQFLAPATPSLLFEKHWEREWLLVRGGAEDKFDGLLDLSDIEDILADSETRSETVGLVGGRASETPETRSANATEAFNDIFDVCLHGVSEGRTLVFNGLHQRVRSLSRLAAHLEKAFGFDVQCNAYLTPAGGQGFKCHFDTHNVFVLQVMGSKRWRVGQSEFPYPLPHHEHDPETCRQQVAAAIAAEERARKELVAVKEELVIVRKELVTVREEAKKEIDAVKADARKKIADKQKKAADAIKLAEDKARDAIAAATNMMEDARKLQKEAIEAINKARLIQQEAELKEKAAAEKLRLVEQKFKQVDLLQHAAAKASGAELLNAENRMTEARARETKAATDMEKAKAENERVTKAKTELEEYEKKLKSRWEAVFSGMRSMDPCTSAATSQAKE